MKPIWSFAALAVLGAFSMGGCGCAASDVSRPGVLTPRSGPSDFTADELRDFLRQYQKYLYSGPAPTLEIEKDGSRVYVIEINLYPVDYQSHTYCIASVIAEANIPYDDQPFKINWRINPGTFTDVHFHKKYGILTLRNDNGQIPVDPQRSDDLNFRAIHNNNTQNSTYTYLPIVVIGNEMKSPEMCASGDPKIVNH